LNQQDNLGLFFLSPIKIRTQPIYPSKEKNNTMEKSTYSKTQLTILNFSVPSFSSFAKYCIVAIALLFVGNIQAQVATNYIFTESNGTYTAISGGTQLVTTTAGATAFDTDGNSITLVATSQFVFNGTTITGVNMTADGSLWLNPTTTTTGNAVTGPLASTAVAPGVICAMGMNLRSTTIATQVYERRWQDLGTELVFQWQNASRAGQQAVERFSFQIRITKASGVIRVVYGDMIGVAANSPEPAVGLRGATNADFNARRLTNSVPDNSANWGAPNGTAAATNNGHTVRFRTGCIPTSGLTFIWTPLFCTITPTGLTFSNVTATTASISWTAVSPIPTTSYQYYISTVNTAPLAATAPTGTVANNVITANLTGLSSGQTYYVWVRSYCTASDFSTWSASTTFTTPCETFSLPVLQGFNSTTIPSCWTQQNVTGTSPITFVANSANPNTTPQEGTHYVHWSSFNATHPSGNQTRLVSPPISTLGTPSVDVDFQWFKEH
jgi:hypothetical protein